MVQQKFVDRQRELEFLEKKYREDKANLIVIYGRRRVGKTELIKKFLENKKGIYILCSKDSLNENIKELKRKFFEITKREYFLKLETLSFFDIFKYFVEEIGDEKIIIVLDEFPYLIELNPGIVSVFQKIWDELLENTKIFLILCGSSIGMMETEVLGYKSPLYGRRTGEWKVEPLNFRHVKNFFEKYNIEDLFKIYSICGGTPFYLAKLDPELTVEENIKRKILTKGEVLYNEPKVLLKEEFREPKTYMLILKYLALGYNTHGKLSPATGIEKGNLSKYLAVLEETKIIRYVLPLGQRKRGIYIIEEPFFNFWFRFVYPNVSDLEIGLVEEVFSRISPQLNYYYGIMFEYIILGMLKTGEINLPFNFNWFGKWWHKDKEIDIVALNEKTKEILFAECKWQSKVNAKKICKELAEKAQHVQWHNEERKEYFAIFAKSFKEKINEFEGKKVYCFDLKNLERFINLDNSNR